jgi:hypothetical protein
MAFLSHPILAATSLVKIVAVVEGKTQLIASH